LIDELRDHYRASLTKTCVLFKMSRSLYAYKSTGRDASALTMQIKEIAATRVYYGYRRVHVMLRREGPNTPQYLSWKKAFFGTGQFLMGTPRLLLACWWFMQFIVSPRTLDETYLA